MLFLLRRSLDRLPLYYCLVALSLISLSSPALGDEPLIEFDGMSFDTWADFTASELFREQGLRCGSRFDEFASEKSAGDPSDCTMNFTNPSAEYAPGFSYPIQVVVHVITNAAGGQGNISDAMVQSQIDILNEDFLALSGSLGENGNDAAIQFELASLDPGGSPTNGITRSANNTWFNDGGAYYNTLAWDPSRYLNIYTNKASGALGYVPFLPQEGSVGSNSDRVVILWSSFGLNGPIGPPYNKGRTVTHEVGHYFGLWHTFDNGCGQANLPGCQTTGDRVCDTNREQTPHYGCSASSTCTSSDPIDNYMNYTDDLCMEQFTPDQVRRMRCTLENYRAGLIEVSLAVSEATPVARSIVLRQNRPNPFNPTTEISFDLTESGRVSLQVIDVAGRLVRTLTDGQTAAGSHSVLWDGTDNNSHQVPSGIYLYHLITKEGKATRRMVLMR